MSEEKKKAEAITINQKHYGTIEVDSSRNEFVSIIQDFPEFQENIQIERENIPALIQSLLPENKEVKSARELIHEKLVKLSEKKTGLNHEDYMLLLINTCIEGANEFHNQFLSQPAKNKETLTAEEILKDELSEELLQIIEQSERPYDLRYFRRYILNAMERYKSQPALPTKEKELPPNDYYINTMASILKDQAGVQLTAEYFDGYKLGLQKMRDLWISSQPINKNKNNQ